MKTKMLFTLLLSILLVSCRTGPESESKKDDLKIVLQAYYDALAKKDLEKLNELTTLDFVMYDNGNVFTNETAVNSVERIGPFKASFKFDSLHTHADKENASAYYLREAVFTINDTTHKPVNFLESATFRKDKGKWKIRFLHASVRN